MKHTVFLGWGHDFRPSYCEISNVISNLKKRPILSAFTATATEIVKNDIIHLLNLSDPFVLTTGFNRTNLSFSVETPKTKKNTSLIFSIKTLTILVLFIVQPENKSTFYFIFYLKKTFPFPNIMVA